MKLTNSMLMNEDVRVIFEEDLKVIQDHLNNNIELTIDEHYRVFNEAGTYIADIETDLF